MSTIESLSPSESDAATLNRILHLSSANLPVGGYAYSQGLEWAVDAGWVSDARSLFLWTEEQLNKNIASTDLPILIRLYRAAKLRDLARLKDLSRLLVACRETSEFVKDDCERGKALARLLVGLDIADAKDWLEFPDTPFASLFAIIAVHWRISESDCLLAYLWTWLEGQVLAGVKLIPLGQLQGQRLLVELSALSSAAIAKASLLQDDDIGNTLPIVALSSALHETQYTRLFKS